MRQRETDYQNNEQEMTGMVRFGRVTDVSLTKHAARVLFEDTGITSDWLPVLIHWSTHKDSSTEAKGGGSGYAAFETHKHTITPIKWMPSVNEMVCCLYEPVRNGNGVILGGVQPWQ